MPTLQIKNLHVQIDGKKILKGVNLKIRRGETHAIMGPNGGGKSTLAQAISAHPKYQITKGIITFGKIKIKGLPANKIANLGIYLAFQYPQSIPGVSAAHLLKIAARHFRPTKKIALADFNKKLKTAADRLELPKEFLHRGLNDGFSGGEKKKTEILQMSLLSPKLVILDETDSGLDVDALKLVGAEVNRLRRQSVSVLIITHYQRILKHVRPDFVHVLSQGRIVRSGKKDLAEEIEKNGYSKILK